MFDGRLAEDFKLSSGSWVSVGPLRTRFLAAAAPFVQDVVVAGHDRDYIALLEESISLWVTSRHRATSFASPG